MHVFFFFFNTVDLMSRGKQKEKLFTVIIFFAHISQLYMFLLQQAKLWADITAANVE